MSMEPPRPAERPTVGWAVLFELALGTVATLLGWLTNFRPVLVQADARLSWVAAAAAGVVAVVPMLVGLVVLESSSWPPLHRLRQRLDEILTGFFQGAAWWQLAAVATAAGVGEELLFRGWLQSWLAAGEGATGTPWWALACSSVAFGLCHALTPAYAVLATLVGAYLGVLYLVTGHLLAAVVAHALYDFLALRYLLARVRVAPTP